MITMKHKRGVLDVLTQSLKEIYHSPAKILNTVNNDPPNVVKDHLKQWQKNENKYVNKIIKCQPPNIYM